MLHRVQAPARVLLIVHDRLQAFIDSEKSKVVISECPELQVIGQSTPTFAIRLAKQLPPNQIMVDLVVFLLLQVDRPGWIGLARSAASTYRMRYPDVAIAFLIDLPVHIPEAKVGPYGAIAMPAEEKEIVGWLLRILEGEQTRVMMVSRFNLQGFAARYPKLTKREIEVTEQLFKGLSNSEVATSLGILEKTVAIHVSDIYRKTETDCRADLPRLFHDFLSASLVTKRLNEQPDA